MLRHDHRAVCRGRAQLETEVVLTASRIEL